MADGFDIIDIVFEAVKIASTGLELYKNNSATGEKNDHITVCTTGVESKSYVNKAPVVNVSVFIRKHDNGMMRNNEMKSAVRKLHKSLKTITVPVGMYWKSKIVWTEPMGEAKDGFDCMNIRLEVITELNR